MADLSEEDAKLDRLQAAVESEFHRLGITWENLFPLLTRRHPPPRPAELAAFFGDVGRFVAADSHARTEAVRVFGLALSFEDALAILPQLPDGAGPAAFVRDLERYHATRSRDRDGGV